MMRLTAAALAGLLVALPAWAQRTLTVGTGGAFTSIDPHYHRLTPNNLIADHLFDTLVAMDANFQPTPGLALSWTPQGDKLWEVKLRPGVTFHDGSPFTADDVAFTFERIPKVLNSPASFIDAVKPTDRMEIVDPLTIRLHTAVPVPLMPYHLASVRIIGRKNGEGAVTSDYNSGKAAIGTGPFRLESVLLGDKVVFRRNDAYWGPKPVWDTVSYRLIANNASRTAALQAGDVDIIDQVATRDVATLRNDPKLTVVSAPGQRLIYLYVDSGREVTPHVFDLQGKKLAKNPLQDVRVRRALSLAINREGIRTQIMDGFAAPTGQLMPKGATGYDPSIAADKLDLPQARKLLADAGFPQGFAITLHGPNDRYVNDRTIVETVAQMWARIGVKTTVQTTPSSMFFAGAVGTRDEYSVSLTGWAPDTGEASSSLGQIVASSNPAKGRGAVLRPSHYANAATDEVVERALATFDPEAREALYQEATRMGMADVAAIPLHHQENIAAMKKTISLRPRMQEGVRAMEVDIVQ
ncbi:MAG: ABC transporter substrate-binding protein [Gemmatimonadaceae bacterium]|nr:ABC transporter substrate-binding protein [Acetobacteraceae bacterium]